MNLEQLDWEVLDRLRATFLSDTRTEGPYWHTVTDLECYDLTYAERIGWKWDAVLRELRIRGWGPPSDATILDWGCGSGVAGRRVLNFLGLSKTRRLLLHDHSALAVEYAEHRAVGTFPDLTVERADYRFLQSRETIDILVLSHVLNELHDVARAELTGLISRARCVLWVEPGTHEVSRSLSAWREQCLAAGARVVAPCTHQSRCGLLSPGNERHWCHFFAAPPPEIHADSQWVKFGQRAGIDLRSLPYSFLVLEQPRSDSAAAPAAHGSPSSPSSGDASRILGEPRVYKGYAKLFNCSAAGIEELTLQQRVDKALFKELKRARGPLLYRWTREGTQITSAEPAYPVRLQPDPDSGMPESHI